MIVVKSLRAGALTQSIQSINRGLPLRHKTLFSFASSWTKHVWDHWNDFRLLRISVLAASITCKVHSNSGDKFLKSFSANSASAKSTNEAYRYDSSWNVPTNSNVIWWISCNKDPSFSKYSALFQLGWSRRSRAVPPGIKLLICHPYLNSGWEYSKCKISSWGIVCWSNNCWTVSNFPFGGQIRKSKYLANVLFIRTS